MGLAWVAISGVTSLAEEALLHGYAVIVPS